MTHPPHPPWAMVGSLDPAPTVTQPAGECSSRQQPHEKHKKKKEKKQKHKHKKHKHKKHKWG
jgi:hypothetical protein|eukprot:COSAG01_NODE_4126_length_5322_cov_3.901511_2_plen_62_part_00